jgi:peptidoglycan/LPS O-acetylase OafA/YrhL
MRHLPAIDGLRAVAVLAVVAYHAGLPVPAGFVGVDIFFVISGYLITRLLHDEVQATGRIDFMGFYARRARRILPALAVVVLAALGLSVLLQPDAGEVARSAAAAGAFVANVFFQWRTGDYWAADSATMPLLHLWSLSVEEQFYLVWPVVLILARRKPVAALATLAVASLALAEWWLWRDPTAAFYQMPARAWELALGGLVALRPVNVPKGSAWIGLAVVLLACFVPFAHFPGIGALPAVAGSALLIASIQNGEAPRLLTLRPVVFVGLVSYSFYLWHWPLLALAHATHVGELPLIARLGLCVVAFVMACASYRYVETPFRRSRASSRRAVAVGLASLAVLSCGAFAYASSIKPDAAAFAAMDYPANRNTCHQQWLDPVALSPTCQTRRGNPEVVIWGDSMALAWQPFAYVVAGEKIAASYTRDACPPWLDYAPDKTKRRDVLCREFERAALKKAQQAETVILVARWAYHDNLSGLDLVLGSLPHAIIIGPTPELSRPVSDCLRLGDPCAVPRESFLRDTAKARGALMAMAAKYHAQYVDPTDFFCGPTTCAAMRNGIPLYWDSHHISSTAAREFAATSYRGSSPAQVE